jgi:hypothetical protein
MKIFNLKTKALFIALAILIFTVDLGWSVSAQRTRPRPTEDLRREREIEQRRRRSENEEKVKREREIREREMRSRQIREEQQRRDYLERFLREYVKEKYRLSVASSFEGTPEVIRFRRETTVYRYTIEGRSEKGFYYSPTPVRNPKTELALEKEPNKVSVCTIPKETVALYGRVARKYGEPGGGKQIYIPEKEIEKIRVVRTFNYEKGRRN